MSVDPNHSKTGPFVNSTHLDHSKTGLVRYSDGYCSWFSIYLIGWIPDNVPKFFSSIATRCSLNQMLHNLIRQRLKKKCKQGWLKPVSRTAHFGSIYWMVCQSQWISEYWTNSGNIWKPHILIFGNWMVLTIWLATIVKSSGTKCHFVTELITIWIGNY